MRMISVDNLKEYILSFIDAYKEAHDEAVMKNRHYTAALLSGAKMGLRALYDDIVKEENKPEEK